jgi:isopenicillin-N N-acyltransferase-like protein
MERGRQYGREAADRIALAIDLYRAEFARKDVAWSEAQDLAGEFLVHMRNYDAELVTELEGIAEGARQTLPAITIINARTEIMYWKARKQANPQPLPVSEECTSAVATPEVTADGRMLHAMNWDWQVDSSDTIVVLHIAASGDAPAILTSVEAGQLARHGFNDAGIAITTNGLHSSQDYGRFGIPSPMIRRRMLMSRRLSAAMFALNNAQRAFSHYMALSDAGGEAIGIEATPDDLFVLEPEHGLLVHANHFQSPVAQLKLTDLNIARLPETIYRERRVSRLLRQAAGRITVDTLKSVLADSYGSPDAVCRSPAARPGGMVTATVYTLIMDAGAKSMWLAPKPYLGANYTEYRLDA